MRLPTRIRYAVRAIVELAERQAKGPVSVKVLAQAQGMSSKYGKQLLNRLQRAGIVKGFPGARGGYVLARKPVDISVLDVFTAMEGSVDLVPCLENAEGCRRRRSCSVRAFWKGLGDSLEKQLQSVTIDDLARDERPMRKARRPRGRD